jgi:ankyrin repeat protein
MTHNPDLDEALDFFMEGESNPQSEAEHESANESDDESDDESVAWDDDFYDELLQSVLNRDFEHINTLLEENPHMNVHMYDEYEDKKPVFLVATENEDIQMMRFLLGHGFDPSIDYENSYPVITVAARLYNLDMLTLLLLTEQSFINEKHSDEDTPFMLTPLLAAVGYGDDVTAFGEAGDIDCVRLLLDKGADPNITCDHQSPLLQSVFAMDAYDIAEMLIQKGADVHFADGFGFTALHYAALHNFDDLCKLLVKSGADVNARSFSGKTPLACATDTGLEESIGTIRLLLSLRAYPYFDRWENVNHNEPEIDYDDARRRVRRYLYRSKFPKGTLKFIR